MLEILIRNRELISKIKLRLELNDEEIDKIVFDVIESKFKIFSPKREMIEIEKDNLFDIIENRD